MMASRKKSEWIAINHVIFRISSAIYVSYNVQRRLFLWKFICTRQPSGGKRNMDENENSLSAKHFLNLTWMTITRTIKNQMFRKPRSQSSNPSSAIRDREYPWGHQTPQVYAWSQAAPPPTRMPSSSYLLGSWNGSRCPLDKVHDVGSSFQSAVCHGMNNWN